METTPNFIIVQCYNSVTLEFTGYTQAYLSPLDSVEGEVVWHLPAFSTQVELPDDKLQDGYSWFYSIDDEEWIQAEDHIGEHWFDENNTEIVIATGGVIPESWSREPYTPELKVEDMILNPIQLRSMLLEKKILKGAILQRIRESNLESPDQELMETYWEYGTSYQWNDSFIKFLCDNFKITEYDWKSAFESTER